MSDARQVLFIQGGGEGTHDEWDDTLVESLRRALGDGFAIRYPRMPAEEDPEYAAWSSAVGRELAALSDGDMVVGHSIGGTILVQTLVEHPPRAALGAIVLIAAPFIGEGGWPGDEFAFAHDLGDALPSGVPVHVFHGLDDDTVPPAHADRFASAVPHATVHRLPGRDHQLGDDLAEVAAVIARRSGATS